MDAKDRLKQYLEQRRELGERELVLDGMSVDDVMRIVGAVGKGPPRAKPEPAAEPAASDWRQALRASGVDPSAAAPAARRASPERSAEPVSASPEQPTPKPSGGGRTFPGPATGADAVPTPPGAEPAPPGIVFGTAARELFGSPLEKLTSLAELAEVIRTCTRCSLYRTAKNPVPGEGDPNAELVCVGEAPGATEDETGRPFIGQAGQLLTKILAAIELRREDVFICNVLKHRPPGNRNPMPEELTACSPYLVRQLDLIRPKCIVAFGTFAAQTLLNTKLPIGKLRGSVHRYYGIPLIVTYHPAALLRNPAWKRPTWEDVQLARRILDTTPRAS